ncbi:glycosyltransferase [Thiorhodovibrio frisius]|uniref:Putative glycosyltransferase n=1 Tax=Thiorhodovibrio frisius TaxID=631362 RepID=H8Z1V7_9GAMM|nr:glycosyltransferase [Thiorhodovibrio frisius]EIC22585.1 putative glycosyltransferase [Thiorhodovibrio frisius]WPL20026.1 putative glycosyl hydrolase [Thiorhodovibrio frisius]
MKILFKHRLKARQGELLLAGLWLLRALAITHPLRQRYRSVLIHLLKKTQLFDRTWYLDTNPDVQDSGIPPLRHYAAYGDAENRWPLPLFDPGYYRARATGRLPQVNALLHYYHVGRYRLISPSSWFDLRYYLSHNKDIARSQHEPLRHYLNWGGLQGRSPNPQFDGAYYLRTNPEVREARLNPLLHYLHWGRFSERPTRDLHADAAADQPPQAPTPDAWAHLKPVAAEDGATVDVVIPVYRDNELTLRCIRSVLQARTNLAFDLSIIDDASPEPDLSVELEALAAKGLFRYQRQPANRGFVATANAGLALHPDRDVVLLNADTEVYDHWLDRLHAAAYSRPRIASVTPLSNNATICSYPRFLHDTPYPLEISYAHLDALTARVNAGQVCETPTGVGFCLYLRREALSAIGHFDEKTFGRGYGEENDFCQRALRAGWVNLITADTFVRHIGAASFQGEKGRLLNDAMKRVARRYPNYRDQVDSFIRRDPLAQARRRLDRERLAAQARAENVLIVCHNRGGGAERHVSEDTKALQAQGFGVYYLRPDRARATHVRLAQPNCRQLLNLPSLSLAETDDLAEQLRPLRICRIHSHGLIDFTADAAAHILALARALDASLEVDIHDYKVICPRVNLADRHGRYCGEPEAQGCNACLARDGNDFGATNIQAWRALHHQVLQAAERVWVPDEDVAERLKRYYQDVRIEILPHEPLAPTEIKAREPRIENDEPLRIVVIGAIGKLKGYEVLLACARDAQQRRLPLAFHLLGYSIRNEPLTKAGVRITGRYLDEEATTRLQALDPHVAWFPYTWPETYSYTLSLALRGGYPVFAFDLGAIARRLRALQHPGALWPLALADQPQRINQAFTIYRNDRLA